MPRADSQGGFGMGGAGKDDPGTRGRRACSGGSPSQCPQRQKKRMGKGFIMAAPPLACHATMTPCYGVRLFPHTFPVVMPFAPAPSGCFFTAKSCPLPGSALQTPLSSTRLPFTTGDSRFRLECTELPYRSCMRFLLCLAFHRPSAVFSFDSLKFLFCPS